MSTEFLKKHLQPWILFVLGSVLFLLLPVFLSPDFGPDLKFIHIKGFQRSFLSYLFLLLLFYIHHFILLPRFFFQKSYWVYALSLLFFFVVSAYLPHQLIHKDIFANKAFKHVNGAFGHPLDHRHFSFFYPVLQQIVQGGLVILFSYSLSLYARLKKSEQARTEAELAYLKAQINPHFLFNTLNSIYSLAIQKSDQTADAVVQLSNLMRYVLTEATKDFVPLSKELEYLADYIALQSTRLTKNVDFHYEQIGEASGQMIAPMLVVPLIENTFKYGANPDEPCAIYLCIEVKSDELFFVAKNKKIHNRSKFQESSKMGLINVQKRLEAVYPSQSVLKVIDDEEYFVTTLTIRFL